MRPLSIIIAAALGNEASVAGLMELIRSFSSDDAANIFWCYDLITDLPPADAIACTRNLPCSSGLPRLEFGDFSLEDLGNENIGYTSLIDPALFQPTSELPSRKLRRIAILAHPQKGFSLLPLRELQSLAREWELVFFVDDPTHLSTLPQGLMFSASPRGRLWVDRLLMTDCVIAQCRKDAILANATLRPALLVNDEWRLRNDIWPFLWPTQTNDMAQRLRCYDADAGAPALFNWKRSEEENAVRKIANWLSLA